MPPEKKRPRRAIWQAFAPKSEAHAPKVAPVSSVSQTDAAEQLPPFRYGNYRAYYGVRSAAAAEGNSTAAPGGLVRETIKIDHRISEHRELWGRVIPGKCVLDIGCNSGLLTVQLAVLFNPERIQGIDVDPSLVERAWDRLEALHLTGWNGKDPLTTAELLASDHFQRETTIHSLRDAAWAPDAPREWPWNVQFTAGNFMLLAEPMAQFDTILCLSVTKWIHLAHGDSGIRTFFDRLYASLRPGGVLVLEWQPASSYERLQKSSKTRSTLTSAMSANLESLEFMPGPAWVDDLLHRVGFSSCKEVESMDESSCRTSGFSRPIYVLSRQ